MIPGTPYGWMNLVARGDAARTAAEAEARWPDVTVTVRERRGAR